MVNHGEEEQLRSTMLLDRALLTLMSKHQDSTTFLVHGHIVHTFQKDCLCQYFATALATFGVVLLTSVSTINVIRNVICYNCNKPNEASTYHPGPQGTSTHTATGPQSYWQATKNIQSHLMPITQ